MGLSTLISQTILLTVAVNAQSISPGFSAPPLEDANLACYTILFFGTLAQLVCAVSYLFRAQSAHILPGVAAVVVLLLLGLMWTAGIVSLISNWTYNVDFQLAVSGLTNVRLHVPAWLLFEWADPTVFALVALILDDRYRTFKKHAASIQEFTLAMDCPLPLLPLAMLIWLIITVLFIASSTRTGIITDAYRNFYNNVEIDNFGDMIDNDQNAQLRGQFDARSDIANRFDYVYVAGVIIVTLCLFFFANAVHKRVKNDKIARVTLFWVIPLLGLRTLARLILEVINARLPLASSFTDEDAFALDLASTIIYGVLHFLAMSILVYFLLYPRLWNGPGEQKGVRHSWDRRGHLQPVVEFSVQKRCEGQTHARSPADFVHPETPRPSQGSLGLDGYLSQLQATGTSPKDPNEKAMIGLIEE
ncbi:hypothetical protein K439DRAFT_1657428 [Ramaria rubella]|nr:hypothetical protein K439DRAFT_1657428 [Ramaria rubella]